MEWLLFAMANVHRNRCGCIEDGKERGGDVTGKVAKRKKRVNSLGDRIGKSKRVEGRRINGGVVIGGW